MNFAYGWAFAQPARKLYYNITITALSVAVALIIGTIELVSILADQFRLTTGPLVAVASLHLDHVGFAIVGIFVLTWLVAIAVWRYGHLEERWAVAPTTPDEQDLKARRASTTPSAVRSHTRPH